MNKLILDTNFILGLIDNNDKWHPVCLRMWDVLKNTNTKVVYLDCVLNEVLSVLGKRFLEKNKSAEFARVMRETLNFFTEDKVTWLYPNIRIYHQDTLQIIQDSSGRLNYHDALMATFSKRAAIRFLISFDEDFDEISWLNRIKNIAELKEID